MATIDMQQVAFNIAKPGAILKFRIKEKTAFVATAKLDLDTDIVARFKSVEIVGKVVAEPLTPPGLYTLEVKAVLTSKTATYINVEVSVASPGKSPEVQLMTFIGKKRNDVCQALAFILIQ